MNDTLSHLTLLDREIILVGTAHVSKESVEEVERVIREESPDCVCVELDAGRYNSMTEPSTRFVKRGTISPRTSEKIIRMAIS